MSLNFSDGLVNVDNVEFSLWRLARPALCHTAHFSSCELTLTVIDLTGE